MIAALALVQYRTGPSLCCMLHGVVPLLGPAARIPARQKITKRAVAQQLLCCDMH
jgi:hypothetical protein